MSLVWAGAVVTRAKKEGRIKDDFAFRTIIKEINKFRSGCGGLLDYDWISIPLVYTQVVTLAVYSFFLSSLMGRQFLDVEKGYDGHEVDLYVPVFTFLQFFFYMGWLKVAEVLINPFGEDDDDFEMNWLIDRNLQVAYLIVDEMHAEHPELVKDQFWDEGVPDELPYTLAAEEFRQADPWQGSTAEVEVPEEQSEFVYLEKIDEESDDGGEIHSDSDDDNLKEVKIGDINGGLTTKPVTIANGKLKSVRASVASNLGNLSNRRNESSTSMMGMIRRVFTGTTQGSGSRLNLAGPGVGSILSVSSRAGSIAPVRTGSRIRNRRSRPGYHRSISNASPMSHESINQGLSRVNTHEQAIFKMSDTSSVNSINTESDFPSRSNSEAKALREVRDLLQTGLDRDRERRKSQDDQEIKSFRLLKKKRKEDARRAEDAANVAMLKKKLEQVENLQAQIRKSLDAELKQVEMSDCELDAEDAIQLLEQKTVELKQSYRRAGRLSDTTHDTSLGTDMETTWTCASSSPVPDPGASIRRSRHPSFTLDTSGHGGGHGHAGGPVRGSVSTGVSQSSPGSPVHRPEMEPPDMFAPKFKPFPPKHNPGSSGSFSNEVFDIESVREADDEDEADNEEDDGEDGEESEPQSVVENVASKDATDGGQYFAEDWDNLGTIEEQPELGYQSDSSDTAELLRTRTKIDKNGSGSGSDTVPLLPTVPEEN